MKYTSKDSFPVDTGIYKIYFKELPHIFYIGSALKTNDKYQNKGFRHRWGNHISKLLRNIHHSYKLQNAFNKYNIESLIFEIIENCIPEKGVEGEQLWIDYYDSYNKGYNCTPLANSQLGFKHSNYSKLKMSKTKLKILLSKYEKESILLYSQNITIKEIASKLNTDSHTISKILKLNNISLRNSSNYKNLKDIYCYDLNGNFLFKDRGIYRIAKLLNIKEGVVRQCVTLKSKRGNKYYFSYYNLNKEDFLYYTNNTFEKRVNYLKIKLKNEK